LSEATSQASTYNHRVSAAVFFFAVFDSSGWLREHSIFGWFLPFEFPKKGAETPKQTARQKLTESDQHEADPTTPAQPQQETNREPTPATAAQ